MCDDESPRKSPCGGRPTIDLGEELDGYELVRKVSAREMPYEPRNIGRVKDIQDQGFNTEPPPNLVHLAPDLFNQSKPFHLDWNNPFSPRDGSA